MGTLLTDIGLLSITFWVRGGIANGLAGKIGSFTLRIFCQENSDGSRCRTLAEPQQTDPAGVDELSIKLMTAAIPACKHLWLLATQQACSASALPAYLEREPCRTIGVIGHRGGQCHLPLPSSPPQGRRVLVKNQTPTHANLFAVLGFAGASITTQQFYSIPLLPSRYSAILQLNNGGVFPRLLERVH
jgi:hypothetical protein